MLTKTIADTAKEVAPPAIISVATFMGLGLQGWVYTLTAIYTAIQILRLIPKIIGCGNCFYKNGTCNLSCRSTVEK